jgi:hypothetical protein
MTDSRRFERAIERFDAANAEDPNSGSVAGQARPKELLYAERLTAMLGRFAPEASEALRLAARCQHIQRWKIPRSDYPMTRAGYHQWRARLRDFHADFAASILSAVGYDDTMTGRVRSLIRKEGLKVDPEAQALEDVVALVFFESYLDEFVDRHGDYDETKFSDILSRTAKKMSARGREAALTMITLPAALEPVVRNAMGGPDIIR